jgi:hypothetical protein
LEHRNLDLFQVFTRIQQASLLQFNNIAASYDVPGTIVHKGPKIHRSIEYLSPSISKQAMILISEQISHIEGVMAGMEQSTACSGKFTRTMGLPCWHRIQDIAVNEERKLLLADVHSHWHLKKTPAVQQTPISVEQEFQLALVETQKSFQSCRPHEKEIMLNALSPIRFGPAEPIKNFETAKTVGRPKKADNSTKRDPSGFEISHGPFH